MGHFSAECDDVLVFAGEGKAGAGAGGVGLAEAGAEAATWAGDGGIGSMACW